MRTEKITFKEDWESSDKRYRYRKGDVELYMPEVSSDSYFAVVLDVGIYAIIPREYFNCEEEKESRTTYALNETDVIRRYKESLEYIVRESGQALVDKIMPIIETLVRERYEQK